MWTYSYPLPIDLRNTGNTETFASAINFGNDIWTTVSYKRRQEPFVMEIWVFNTETCQYRKVNFETPPNFGDFVFATKKVEDHIYIWTACGVGVENILFKLDTETCTVSYILTISVENQDINKECAVIGNIMYVLEYEGDEIEGVIYLHTINLDTKKVESKQPIKNVMFFSDVQLLANNDELYLYESVSKMNRIIYKINNGQLTIVSEDQWNNEEDELIQCSCWDENGILYRNLTGVVPIVYRDTFDYKAHKWIRSLAVKPYSYPYVLDIQGSCHINGNVYTLIDRSHLRNVGYDIRVYEKVPRLDSCCIMPIVEELMTNNNVDLAQNVRNALPITLRMQLDNTMNWRVWKVTEMTEMEIIVVDNDSEEMELEEE